MVSISTYLGLNQLVGFNGAPLSLETINNISPPSPSSFVAALPSTVPGRTCCPLFTLVDDK